jgi:ParB-like chromosome segregation protein Spo0J
MKRTPKPFAALAVESAPIDSLHLDPANVRRHPERNLDTIKASLARFGQQKPIVVDTDGIVRAGNGTLEAARALGWESIQVVRTPLKGSEATAYAIADNRTSELAEWDDTALAEQLRALQSEDFDLGAVGYTDDELERMIAGLTMPTDGDMADAIGGLPDGDKSPFQQMTFTVTDEQADAIKDAMDRAKAAGPFVNTGNENSNGNALARIAETYLGIG